MLKRPCPGYEPAGCQALTGKSSRGSESALGLPFFPKIFPVNVMDLILEHLGHLNRIRTAEPRIPGVQIHAERIRVAEAIHHILDALDAVGNGAVRFEENMHSVVRRHLHGSA